MILEAGVLEVITKRVDQIQDARYFRVTVQKCYQFVVLVDLGLIAPLTR